MRGVPVPRRPTSRLHPTHWLISQARTSSPKAAWLSELAAVSAANTSLGARARRRRRPPLSPAAPGAAARRRVRAAARPPLKAASALDADVSRSTCARVLSAHAIDASDLRRRVATAFDGSGAASSAANASLSPRRRRSAQRDRYRASAFTQQSRSS